jgi:hypothetical protein
MTTYEVFLLSTNFENVLLLLDVGGKTMGEVEHQVTSVNPSYGTSM